MASDGNGNIAYADLDDGQRALVDSTSRQDRNKAAALGYGRDRLVHDDEAAVRALVASSGYGHDELCRDESTMVRMAVARHATDRDVLASLACLDQEKEVRQAARASLRALPQDGEADDDDAITVRVNGTFCAVMRVRPLAGMGSWETADMLEDSPDLTGKALMHSMRAGDGGCMAFWLNPKWVVDVRKECDINAWKEPGILGTGASGAVSLDRFDEAQGAIDAHRAAKRRPRFPLFST